MKSLQNCIDKKNIFDESISIYMHPYITTLIKEFRLNANNKIALEQSAYMRNQFSFFGIKTIERRALQQAFLAKEMLPDKKELEEIISTLWKQPQRECHYFAQELAFKYIKQLEKRDIYLYEFMVINQSWWDTVDFIATKLMGAYFKKFPEQKAIYVTKWLKSGNIWLQRCALLFQLKYKEETDILLLSNTINALLGNKEFFINKAIGWILREYSKTNPEWVTTFAENTALSPLSKKEALRLMK
ncbi:MAG TPA: DNA alkylation repair protein [Vicingaceae bacterium]